MSANPGNFSFDCYVRNLGITCLFWFVLGFFPSSQLKKRGIFRRNCQYATMWEFDTRVVSKQSLI